MMAPMMETKPTNVTSGATLMCMALKISGLKASSLEAPPLISIRPTMTTAMLTFTYFARPRQKEKIGVKDAFIIGVAQACAVLPGLSRSGSTIATGLLLGNKKERMAQFSFIMVIPPILGEALLNVLKVAKGEAVFSTIGTLPLVVGFVAAFVSGCFACRWMIDIVKRGKLVYFGIYCAVVGLIAIAYSLLA